MKLTKLLTITLTLSLLLSACGTAETGEGKSSASLDAVEIRLHDSEITVDGTTAETTAENAVYVGSDIVYYEDGKDFTYGEGTVQDAHSAETAAAHTVVHIAQPGTYRIQGSLSRGQIAVDLGEDAKNDPNAVVTLILNGVDISCEVAPAIIFYRVYECDSADTATKDVDTSSAGANVIIADGSENTVNGAYVARIYKPGSVVLDESGTEVADAEKLHKYDGAFYSRMSMNINGGAESNGILTINAVNEGLGSELHLTVNGGIIRINSGNDGINTNEDGKSVTTINGGELHITVTGETGEGDGIDSNGWLVINGGTVIAQACSFSEDAGIDSDMGIHINGGTVIAGGHMLDRIEDGGQNYAVFSFAQEQGGTDTLRLKDASDATVAQWCFNNDYSILIYSSPELTAGNYTLWCGETQLAGASGSMMGSPMDRNPSGMTPPAFPEGTDPAAGSAPPDAPPTDGQEPPARPDGAQPPQGGDRHGAQGDRPEHSNGTDLQALDPNFTITAGGNLFQGISPMAG